RIYRGTSPNVPVNAGSLVIDENTSGAAAPSTDGYGNYSWDDTTAAACQPYYYRIATVEWCVANNAYNTNNNLNSSISDVMPPVGNPGIQGQTGTTGAPAAPV